MKKNHRSRIAFVGAVTLLGCCLFILSGCKEEKGNTVFDLVTPGKPQPVIDSLSPVGKALAAADDITLYGKNFSTSTSENYVYFNGKAAKVVKASATKLVVNSAVDTGDVAVKVSIAGAELFSAALPYRLDIALETFGNFTPPATGVAATTPDATGNLYCNFLGAGVDIGIYVLSPNGTKRLFAPNQKITFWSSLKLGPGGTLYSARGASAVFKFGLTDSVSAPWVTGIGTIKDIDFDQNKYLWAGGNSTRLNCIKQDKSVTLIPFTGTVRALRVFGNYLYFSALKDSAEKIFRATINNDTLGTVEEYFNITSSVGSTYIGQALTFSSDGSLYIGTQSPMGIIVVAPDGSHKTPYSAYSSFLGTSISSLSWGPGDILYATTFEGNLLRIYTKKTGAPYYGLN